MNRFTIALLGAVLCGASAHAHDYKVGSLEIDHPWTRVTPPGSQVAAGFMTITNTGAETDRLTGGSATISGIFEVHEMKMDGGIMRMRHLSQGLEIKPGQTVELKPGGYHVMFMQLKAPIKDQTEVKGTLTFEKAGTVEVTYKVEAMGARGSATDHGDGHGGHGAGHGKPKS